MLVSTHLENSNNQETYLLSFTSSLVDGSHSLDIIKESTNVFFYMRPSAQNRKFILKNNTIKFQILYHISQ